jgi:hypothetical protein
MLALTGLVLNAQSSRAEDLVAPPFVGCPADGQVGPIDAPTKSANPVPKLPAPVAARLAYYVSQNASVLAPRGWHCFGTYGSGGSSLIVTPEPHGSDDLFKQSTNIVGPAVESTWIFGGTSGRFAVAEIAARLFPSYMDFVRSVVEGWKMPEKDLPVGPYPADTVIPVGPSRVKFITPAHSTGMGTRGYLAASDLPIQGIVTISPLPELSEGGVSIVDIRLPPDLADLIPAIRDKQPTPPDTRG